VDPATDLAGHTLGCGDAHVGGDHDVQEATCSGKGGRSSSIAATGPITSLAASLERGPTMPALPERIAAEQPPRLVLRRMIRPKLLPSNRAPEVSVARTGR
jgi:hypothetical protein